MIGESEIRAALWRLLRKPRRLPPGAVVVSEMNFLHNQRRADLMVFGNYIHGYEIKGEKDTLKTLPDQLAAYRQGCQKVTVVVAPNHLPELEWNFPRWTGLWVATEGPREQIKLKLRHRPKLSHDIEPLAVASLLWIPEARDILCDLGMTGLERKSSNWLSRKCAATSASRN